MPLRDGCGCGLHDLNQMALNRHDKEALEEFVRQLCALGSLEEMQEFADEHYTFIKTAKPRPKGSAAVEVFIANVLKGYLANPVGGDPRTLRSDEFSHEIATVRNHLRKLGVFSST